MENKKSSFIGLVPFIIFILVYLGSGMYFQAKGVEMAFYQLPAPVAIFIGIIAAFALFKGSITHKFDSFLKGCGEENIIIMCIIYLLAGAFASVSKSMGGVDATVNFGLTYIPAQYVTAGMFIIAAFIATATGTSVGAVVALGPIAIGLAEKGGISMPIILAALMGGAMFGDNLSVISDTTIAATRTQGVEMRDKFRVNLTLALPAAVVTVILLLIFGKPEVIPEVQEYSYSIIKVLPYILVLGLSLAGMNVFVVLTLGIAVSGVIGFAYGEFTFLKYAQGIYAGFTGMTEIFLLSLLTGGLAVMVREAGGIDWLIEKIQKIMTGKKSAILGVGLLVGLIDMAVANNTVAIIISGPIAKKISNQYKIDPRKTATVLDVFSCIAQGAIPYGAQMLILLGFTQGAVSFLDVFPLLWYQGMLLILSILSFFIPFADYYINKNPWDWSKEELDLD
ncbi:Na+/H+ antiporter NhaC family protein [Fusobacterium perfoetens]|uniref:Na+/H+ antiporter NhaC family protein n=1 Tax=Fusobacterium perfoetens TaxID=852 RepID=UPI001F1A5621|nr:Na+/H+ antiporter NhaC family protein [Fusobacterium perfoetens]MCF2625025.1 Na+/H+ antiporter NhaC family protein [Fusobacterium perfoetens]